MRLTLVPNAELGIKAAANPTLAVTPAVPAALQVQPTSPASVKATPVENAQVKASPLENAKLSITEVCSVSGGTIMVLAATDGRLRLSNGGYWRLDPSQEEDEG